MKICFLTLMDPKDNKSWSGTFVQMFKNLQKYHEVEWIGDIKFNTLQKIMLKSERVFNKYIKRKIPLQSSMFGYLYAKNVKPKIDAGSYDIIYAPVASNLFSFLDTKLPIIYLSDATFQAMVDYYPEFTGLSRKMVEDGNKIEQHAIDKADKILYCSDWAKNSAIDYYKASPAKVSVAEFGANLLREPALEDLDFSDSYECNIVFVGVNWERKGGEIAYKTFLVLKKKGFACTFTIIGCKPVLDEMEGITIIPFINKNDLQDFERFYNILLKSHILLLPSKAECFGIVFCEASAFGIPSFSTNTGGIPSAIHDGVNGFLFDTKATEKEYADKIYSVFTDKPSYKKLRMSSRKDFENRLNWDAWAKTFNNVAAS